jgi:hypothetical protein
MPPIRLSLRGFSCKALAIALALPLGAVVLAVAPATAAMACTVSNDCHSIVEDDMGHNNGVLGTIYFTCLHSPDSSDFVTNEMWDNTGSGGPLGAYWVEDGVVDGVDPQNGVDHTRNWFWADFRPGDTNINIHFPSGFGEAAYSTSYPASIAFDGGSSQAWAVFGGDSDVLMGTSTSQPNNTTDAYSGTEYSDGQGLRDSGNVSALTYYDSSFGTHRFGIHGYFRELGPNASVNPLYDNSSSTVSWADC